MNDGAFGLSTGLEYDPGRFSETREVVALTRVVKPYGGFYISHERSEGADPMWKVASDPTPFVSLLEAVQRDDHDRARNRRAGRRVAPEGEGRDLLGIEPGGDAADSRSARRRASRSTPISIPYETSGTDGNTVLVPGWALQPPGQAIGRSAAPPAGRGGGAGDQGRFKARLGIDDDVRKIRHGHRARDRPARRRGADHHQRVSGSEVRQQVAAVRRRRSEDAAGRRGDLAAVERRRPRRRRAHARLLALGDRPRRDHAAGLHRDLHRRRHRRASARARRTRGSTARCRARSAATSSIAGSSSCRSRFDR